MERFPPLGDVPVRRGISVFVDQFAMEMMAEKHRRRREAGAAHARRLALLDHGWSLQATMRAIVSSGWVRAASGYERLAVATRGQRQVGSSP
jgi:hypothetical protein